jgi:hypothetical protein
MNLSDPVEFYKEVALPNFDAFKADFLSAQLAVNAVLSTDALAGIIFIWARTSSTPFADLGDGKYRERLAANNLYFALVREWANAIKHGELTRSKFVRGVAEIEKTPARWDETLWDEGRWDAEQIVCKVDGIQRSVEYAVGQALSLMKQEIEKVIGKTI